MSAANDLASYGPGGSHGKRCRTRITETIRNTDQGPARLAEHELGTAAADVAREEYVESRKTHDEAVDAVFARGRNADGAIDLGGAGGATRSARATLTSAPTSRRMLRQSPAMAPAMAPLVRQSVLQLLRRYIPALTASMPWRRYHAQVAMRQPRCRARAQH